MWNSWILESQNYPAFEPILLSSTPCLSPTAAISTTPSRLSQRDAFYQVAADAMLAAGWPASISLSTERLCRLFLPTEQHQRTGQTSSDHLTFPPQPPALREPFKATLHLYWKIRSGLINTFI